MKCGFVRLLLWCSLLLGDLLHEVMMLTQEVCCQDKELKCQLFSYVNRLFYFLFSFDISTLKTLSFM